MLKQPTRGQRKLQLLEKLESEPGYVLDAYRQAFQVDVLPLNVRANPRLVEEILEREFGQPIGLLSQESSQEGHTLRTHR